MVRTNYYMTERLCALRGTAVQSTPNSSPSPESFCQRHSVSLSTIAFLVLSVKTCICLNVLFFPPSNKVLCHRMLFIVQFGYLEYGCSSSYVLREPRASVGCSGSRVLAWGLLKISGTGQVGTVQTESGPFIRSE